MTFVEALRFEVCRIPAYSLESNGIGEKCIQKRLCLCESLK